MQDSDTDWGLNPLAILREAVDATIAAEWAMGKSMEEMKLKYQWATDEIAQERLAKAIRRDAGGKSEN